MVKAKNILEKNFVYCSPQTSIREAAKLMTEKKKISIPVLEDGKLAGIVSEVDMLKIEEPIHMPTVLGFLGAAVILDNPLNGVEIEKQLKEVLATKVEDIMTKEVVSLTPEADIKEAVDLMIHQGFALLPVLENGKVVGTVSRGDVIRILAK